MLARPGAAKSDYAKAVSDAERAQHAIDLARDLFEAKAIAHKEVRDADRWEACMQCPRCHAENREGRRFCTECGGSLALPA